MDLRVMTSKLENAINWNSNELYGGVNEILRRYFGLLVFPGPISGLAPADQ